MSVKPNGNTSYIVKFKETAKLPPYYKSFTVKEYGSISEAHRAAREHNDLVSAERKKGNAGPPTDPELLMDNISGTTFSEVAEDFIKFMNDQTVTNNRSKRSVVIKTSVIRNILIPHFGDHCPCLINYKIINDFKKDRIEKPEKWGKRLCYKSDSSEKYVSRKPAALTTIRDNIMLVKTICKYGAGIYRKDRVNEDPPYDIKDIRCLHVTLDKLSYLTERKQFEDNEYKALFEAALPHTQRFVFLSYRMGLRPGPVEISSIRWADWDMSDENFGLRVNSAKRTHGTAKYRYVPLEDKADRKMVKEWFLADGRDKRKRMVTYRGKYVKNFMNGFKTAWKKACENNPELTREVHPYLLRHGFGIKLMKANVPAKIGAELMGHSVDVFLKQYGHITEEHKKEAMGKIGSTPVEPKHQPQPAKQASNQ